MSTIKLTKKMLAVSLTKRINLQLKFWKFRAFHFYPHVTMVNFHAFANVQCHTKKDNLLTSTARTVVSSNEVNVLRYCT